MTTIVVKPGGFGNAFNAVTITLASLGSSSTLVAGQEATAISNASSLYADMEMNGLITAGSSPTAGTVILIWGLVPLDDTITWPTPFTGSNAALTLPSFGQGLAYLRLLAACNVDTATSGQGYPFTCPSVADRMGFSLLGKNLSLFVTHNSVAALNGTGSNHYIKYRGFNPELIS